MTPIIMFGAAGNDALRGLAGNDCLYGQAGDVGRSRDRQAVRR